MGKKDDAYFEECCSEEGGGKEKAVLVKKGDRAPFRSGFVSISGRPNVGKSTFLNSILGQKVSIVTSRAQTTRNRITGIKTLEHAQIVFVDTPGIHRPRHGLGAHMVREARQAIKDVDAVLYMVEPRPPAKEDRSIVRTFKGPDKPVILLINKTDRLKKPALLPVIGEYNKLFAFHDIIPVSAIKGEGLEDVLKSVLPLLPSGPMLYPGDMVTDNVERFMVAEIIREKLMEATREEVPHSVAVEVVEWKEQKGGKISINSNILVEKEGQKGIIIGSRGETLKHIGTLARADIEGLLDARVFLSLFVKVKKCWRTDKSVLVEMGYK